jgi:hypothetical protein
MSLHIINPTTLIGNCCFNGSIFVKYKTRDNISILSHIIPENNCKNIEIFCVYRSTPSRQENFQSSLHITPLNIKTYEGKIEHNIILFNNMLNEDPRVLCLKDSLFVSYSRIINSNITKYLQLTIKIEGSFYNNKFEKKDIIVNFDQLNNKNSKQKNWTFFEQNGLIYIVYNIMPLEIYIWNPKDQLVQTTNIVPLIYRFWKHPKYLGMVFRGGCPPIKVDNIFYVFIHSTDYKMFCFTFDCVNFDILSVTLKEIIPNRGNKLDIHFPCGVIYHEKKQIFHISLGIDDVKLGIFTIYKKELDLQMIKVNNFNSVIIKDDILISDMLENNMNLWINSWGGCGNDLLSLFCNSKGFICRSKPWDKIGCHYVKHIDIPMKKIYIIAHPLVSLATMIENKCLETNFYKLSNQIENNSYTLTGLLHFMLLQLLNWYNKPNICILKESTLRNNFTKLSKYLNCDETIFNDYPIKDPNIINIDYKLDNAFILLNKDMCISSKILYNRLIELYNKIDPVLIEQNAKRTTTLSKKIIFK